MTPPENHRQIPPPGPSRVSSAFFEPATACDAASAFERPTAYEATSSPMSGTPHYDVTGSHERPTTHEPAATYERATTYDIGCCRKVAIGSRRNIGPGALMRRSDQLYCC